MNGLLASIMICSPPSRALGHLPQVHGVVRRSDNGAAIADASVRLLVAGTRTRTSGSGTFSMPMFFTGDTLVVAAIGFLPDTVPSPATSGDTLVILLRDAPTTLAELVGSTAVAGQYASGQAGSWTVSGKALDRIPATIEPDISRALALVPGVSFSSFLSARPSLRGLDVDDAASSIDGFRAINLYHAGRIFSSIPALAVDHADVRFQPAAVDVGGTTSGLVNVVGRTADSPASVDFQFGEAASSVAGGAANSNNGTSVFAAARTAKTSLISQQLAEENLNYDFQDGYVNAGARIAGHTTHFSIFSSADHLTTAQSAAEPFNSRLDWSNLVAGVGSELLSSPAGDVVASVAYATHEESGVGVGFRGFGLDIDSRFTTLTGQLDGRRRLDSTVALKVGVDLVEHDVRNQITPFAERSRSLLPINTREHPAEAGAYAELDVSRGAFRVAAGVRVDGANGITAIQPRLSIRLLTSPRSWVEAAVGRSARLFDLLTDVQSEITDASYDFWRSAGVDGTPVATTTSASLAWSQEIGRWQLHADLFGSWGAGDAGLKAILTDADSADIFRYGRAKVHGADVSAVASAPDGRWSAVLSYSWIVSTRNWGGGWVPAINDRQHEGRVFATYRVGRTVHLSSSIDVGSALPFTPIVSWVVAPGLRDQVRPVYGAEMSGRGTGLLRVDAAVLKGFRGPWGSRWEAGVGISNLSWGDQVMRNDSLFDGVNGHLKNGQPGPPYLTEQPAYRYRAIPSILVRGQIGANH